MARNNSLSPTRPLTKQPAKKVLMAYPDDFPPALRDLLETLLGVESFDAVLQIAGKLRVPLKRYYSSVPPPAPKITSHPPGGFVVPGGNESVTITTNAPEMTHEVCLIPKAVLGMATPPAVSHVSISGPITSPQIVNIPIPAGANTEYYLEVGVHADAIEQQRHRIRVKTPALLTGTITGNPLPNPGALMPYGMGTNVNFTLQFNGGFPPYNYTVIFGDGTPNVTGTAPDATPVVVAHPYAMAGKYFPNLIYSDSKTTVPVVAPAGEYNI